MLQRISSYLQLIRFNKPIGTYLILWPTLVALWLASNGLPSMKLLIIFVLGSFVMRSAGCIINDIADRDFDYQVQRTKDRPLTSGKVSLIEALVLLACFCAIALFLVLQLNKYCLALAFISLFLIVLYPFTKRWLHMPQLFLGLAFATSVLMAFAAVQNHIPTAGWWFYTAALIWPIAYDTMYAMVDREDDLKAGIKSTAIWFGRFDKLAIFILQVIVCVLCIYVGVLQHLTFPYFIGATFMAGLFCYQQWLIKDRMRERCFKAFLNNHWAGLCLFIGVVVAFL